jgi:hypothetical protein
MARKRTKPPSLTQESVDRGIYQDIVLRQGDEVVATIPPMLQIRQIHNVWDILAEAIPLQDQFIQTLCRALIQTQTDGNAESAAIFGYQLGRLVERLHVAPHEPAALIGKKCRSGAQQGGIVKQLTDAEKESRAGFYAAGVEVMRRRHPHMGRGAIIVKLARSLGKGHSARTIYTYLGPE